MALLHGYDISGYQGTTAPTGDFVIVKATEGSSFTNSKFGAQWASAKTRTKHRGGYHFARPEESSYQSQADRLLAMVQPVRGESVMLDLEASGLSQAKTNAWARGWGDYIRDRAPGITSLLYMGGGYATNGTGKGLKDHFDFWVYPQYPSVYQLTSVADADARRMFNRSNYTPEREPLAAMTTAWPPSVSPWLPLGLTCGWTKPHIWQFTDNWKGLDADVTALTLDQLATGGQATPTEEDMPFAGRIPAGKGAQVNVSFAKGALKALGLVCDNSLVLDGVIAAEPQAQVRYAIHRAAGTWQTGTAVVGSADGGKDHTPKTVVKFTAAADSDYVSFVRLDDGTRPVGWDMS